ncbi:alkaline phosphatase [Sclerotinia borealis F-4128]|uniref:Alkaline phosphatase n=1 Tax=Sclerotinia borealis (strain F-4128) TaxID=1432307 RepID=W9CNP1_SCLBF|nr:alkaline phosphatase [Sclerotinia borealis F-4128]
MAPNNNSPLFASGRPSSSNSEERAAAEDDALLGNRRKDFYESTKRPGVWREIGLFTWAVVATAAVIVLGVLLSQSQQAPKEKKQNGKRNLIFMVSDGMGPASLSLTRGFRQFQGDLPMNDILQLDKHFIGSSRTRSSSSLITDSAAGATAFSCGRKSYNGAISMLPDHTPCGTVLEAAKKAGYTTGLVVTTDITDATPACFAAHVDYRMQEDSIALQEVGEHPLGHRVVDLMLGGGRCHFLPNTSESSCRADSRDVTKLAQDKYGWTYIDTREDFDKLKLGKKVQLPLLGLFSDTDIPFELDRRNMNDVYPSLDEMARTALTALEAATKDSDQGFFLMIEGSRIDHAGHGNDPAAQVHEVLAYDRAFQSVIDFLGKSDTEGALVATSDHETGGLAVARQLNPSYPQYLWYPEVLANASHSSEYLSRALRAHIASSGAANEGDAVYRRFVKEKLVEEGLGVIDASDEEIDLIIGNPALSAYAFADIISRRAQIGWSTHGHSAVDVNIYGYGAEVLRGNHENIEVGEFLSDYLNVDVDAVTIELNSNKASSQTFSVASKPDVPNFGHYEERLKKNLLQ